MPRLIDANALLKTLDKRTRTAYPNEFYGLMLAHDYIDDFPTVDAVEVVHGEWSTIEDDYCGITALQCSECNQEYWFEDDPPIKIYNYCPNCGAKMDGDKSEP